MLSTVVLPAPFGPMMLVIRPGSARKLTPLAALMPPNAMPRSAATRAPCPSVCATNPPVSRPATPRPQRALPFCWREKPGGVDMAERSLAPIGAPDEPRQLRQQPHHAGGRQPEHHQQQRALEHPRLFG